jgi:hypothetical protein
MIRIRPGRPIQSDAPYAAKNSASCWVDHANADTPTLN